MPYSPLKQAVQNVTTYYLHDPNQIILFFMKTNFSAITVTVLFLILGAYQTLFSQQFSIKSGLLVSSFTNKVLQSYDNFYQTDKDNVFISVHTEFTLNERFSIEPGISFNSKGYAEGSSSYSELPNGVRGVRYSVSISYLELPVLTKFYINSGKTRFFATAGAYVAAGLFGNTKTRNDENRNVRSSLNWTSENQINAYKRLDFGGIFGIGVQSNKMQIGLNIGRGFNTISIFDDIEMSKVRNKTWTLYVGYFI